MYHYVGWYLAVALFAVGKILEVVPSQYEGLSWSSVSQTSSLALTVVLEALFLPDTDLSKLDYLAYAIIIAGLLCTSPLDAFVVGESFATIFSIAVTLFTLFLVVVALRFIMLRKVEIMGLSAESNARLRKYMPLVLMAEVTLFARFVFASTRVTTHFVTAILTIVTIFVIGFILIFLFQLFQLTLSLHDYEFGYIIPLFHVMNRYSQIIMALMLGRAEEGSPWTQIVLPIFGMILMGVAVFILHHFRENFSHFRSLEKHRERVESALEARPKVKNVGEPENTFANAALAALAQKRAVDKSIDQLLRSGQACPPDPEKFAKQTKFVLARNKELEQYARSNLGDASGMGRVGDEDEDSSWSLNSNIELSDYTYSYAYESLEEEQEEQDGDDDDDDDDDVLRGRVKTQPVKSNKYHESQALCGTCFEDSDSSDDDGEEVVVAEAGDPEEKGGRRSRAQRMMKSKLAAVSVLATPLGGPPPPKIKAHHEDVARASGSGWMSLGRGIGWHIPLLPNTDRHSQLERADGMHICTQHWSPLKRCAFCCCFFVALTLIYLLVTITLMVGLYRGCPGLGPFPALAPLPIANYTPSHIRLNHIQQKGNHNSFHVRPLAAFPGFSSGIKAWDFAHDPIETQLNMGNRVFEIDIHLRGGTAAVFHVQLWDDQTNTCSCLVECLRILFRWSLAHPGHTPIVIGLEIKDDWQEDIVAGWNGVDYQDLIFIEDAFKSVWGNRIITPDVVRGNHPNLTHAVLTDGWPSLDECRGKIIVFLDDENKVRELYTSRSPSLEGRTIFTISKGDLEADRADRAVVKINDPSDPQGYDLIVKAVEDGFIVRTRADSNEEYENRDNPERLGLAIESGAQIVSFDFFVHQKWATMFGYGVVAGCNNRTAPADCTPEVVNV